MALKSVVVAVSPCDCDVSAMVPLVSGSGVLEGMVECML